MLTKMSKEELIKKVKELEDEIESFEEDLRMAYKEKQDLQDKIEDMQIDMWRLYDKFKEGK